jgi:hypothetical protein
MITSKQREDEMNFATGVMQDAKKEAAAMLERGETSSSYPSPESGEPSLFQISSEEGSLDRALGSFDLDGVKIYFG